MISNWISSDYHLLGFIDNNSLLWDTKINNLKVYSLQEAVKIIPDIILVTLLNRDGALEIKKQLKEEWYDGKVFNINEFRVNILYIILYTRSISSCIFREEMA